MPAAIDRSERLDAIAVATLELADESGATGVTVRAVAGKLGGSTTLVTKYVPSRAALVANAYRYLSEQWPGDRAARLDQRAGVELLRELANWSLGTEPHDAAIRKLWLAALATGNREHDGVDIPRLQARAERQSIGAVVEEAHVNDPDALADLLFLAFRGYYLSSIEDPDAWSEDRARAALDHLVVLVARQPG